MIAADFDAMRQAMVASQLRTSAVDDPRVVKAMAEVPREAFVPDAQRALAYHDRRVPLEGDRAMNAPLATGRLITEARVGAGDRVLLIGAGTGYAAAVLAKLAAGVIALEEDAALVARAGVRLAGTSNVTVVEGPLSAGWADGAPYDVLIVDGAVEMLPEAVIDQVRPGGRVTAGLVDRGVTRLAAGQRTQGGFGLVDFADSDCVVLPGFSVPETFTF